MPQLPNTVSRHSSEALPPTVPCHLVKYVQPNAADFEIPKLKIRIVHCYVQLLLKMTPKLNDTHFEMVYNLFHSTMEVIIKRIVFVAQSN